MSSLIYALIIIGYFFLPFGAIILLLMVKVIPKGERPPVDFTVLRGPGESLRWRIVYGDENLVEKALLFFAAPWFFGLIALSAGIGLGNNPFTFALLAALLALMLLNCWWVYRYISRRRDDLLDYMGERAVGEWLDTLPREYRVFHDVPVDEGKGAFNLDHVVVGPTGLFAIETKTRRKGRAREGFADHKVFYDGRQLIWPWAEDTYGLQQATNEAEWLTKWLRQMTGLDLTARPVLALPGWWVETRTPGPVAVQNPKNLPAHILGKGLRVLDPQQVDLIARQLDSRCRDVKD